MKILMINGSPHPRGCTYTALHEMERVLRAAGAEVQILTVGAEQIGGCVACGGCRATGRCVRGGLVNDAIDAMETADALVLASPVHYAGISGAMSAFCDRLFYAGGSWANKPCACVVSARRAGTTAALDQLVKYPMISNMPVVSSQYWPMVHGARPEDVAQDEEGLQTMRTLGRNMAFLMKSIALGKEKLGLPEPPGRIEAYDISNTGASDIVAAMTVFADGKPKKSAYRYFLLRDLDGPDDYASMDQVISRRFKREIDGDERFARHPDLLLIDGGQTHAAVARRAMEQYGLDIPTFGMVKDDRHRTRALVTPEGREIGIQGAPALFAFIGQIQEETHRSAVGYHHKRHTKTGLGSALEKIPGIGPARRKQLLKSFGSVKAIRAASLPALMEVVPSAAARAVWQHFHAAPEKTNEED